MSLNNTFRALSDPTRRTILQLLKEKDYSAGDLNEHFSMTFATLSHHLSILKQADLVSVRRNGQKQIYSLNLSVVEQIINEYFIHFKKI